MKPSKFILILIIFCLIGGGALYFSNNLPDNQEESETQIQTTQPLKLLNSHSHPEAGEEWSVSFETRGTDNLTITPQGPDTIDDLDFIFLKCGDVEITPQLLQGDTVFYPDWQCDGIGKLTHLVNIARQHTLKFQFGDLAAFAYNNPDSVTDSFTDESKVSATSSVVVINGQAQLCKENGTGCSVAGECCSGFCVDDVCCNNACDGTPCYICDSNSNAGAGTCGYVNSASDPDGECPGAFGTCAATTCSGSGYSCGYLAVGQQGCGACKYCTGSSYDCANVAANTDPYVACTGNCDECNGSGACRGDSGYCDDTGASCYCAGGGTFYSCQSCANTAASCNCSGNVCQICSDSGPCEYPTCSSYTCGLANEDEDHQETGCNGCDWCDGSGNCLTCSWTNAQQKDNRLMGGASADCKPSLSGMTFYYDSDSASCGATLSSYVTEQAYSTAWSFDCSCQ